MKRERGSVWAAVVAAALWAAAVPALAQGQAQGGPTTAMEGEWHFAVASYMWMPGIEGDVSVAGLPQVPVDASFSDLWDDFDFGLAGRFEGRKNRFGFGLDFTWNNLGAPVASSAPVVGALGLEADVRQLLAEGATWTSTTTTTRTASSSASTSSPTTARGSSSRTRGSLKPLGEPSWAPKRRPSPTQVRKASRSSPCGSAGGPPRLPAIGAF